MRSSAKRGYISTADESYARSLVRALFALVEGIMYAMKVDALMVAEKRWKPLTFAEAALVFEVRKDLNDRGEIVQRPANIPLERNLRFAFRLYAQVFEVGPTLDTNSDWWHALRRSMHVRDCLMHPRNLTDLEIGPKQIRDAVEAKRGFTQAAVDILQHKRHKA
jgi:hypothetical protein